MTNSDNHQVSINSDNSLLIKLTIAYESHDYSLLTLHELFQLVRQRLIRAETALRLAKEASDVH